MLSILEKINDSGAFFVLLCFILVLLFIANFDDTIKKVKKTFNWVDVNEIKEKNFIERMDKLEQRINDVDKRVTDTSGMYNTKLEGFHQQSINIRGDLANKQDETNKKVDSLINTLEKFMNKENETTVAMFRSSLWRLHRDFTQQGFVTPDGLKTFMEMGKVYTAAGGNDIYHEKLLPEVEALEIRYPDENIYK
jgi:hypothetical protein